MNEEQKRLAYEAIDKNVDDTTARQIIKKVLDIQVSQKYISNFDLLFQTFFKWQRSSINSAIYLAKRSGLLLVDGYGKRKDFQINIELLKEKMREIINNKKQKIDFSEFN